MRYPWSTPDADPVLDDALDIAMDYLEFTGQADAYSKNAVVRRKGNTTRMGSGHAAKIRLANSAIVTIEKG